MASRFQTVQQELLNKQHTWLVTGCAGFIGSNILEFLLNHNQKVSVFCLKPGEISGKFPNSQWCDYQL